MVTLPATGVPVSVDAMFWVAAVVLVLGSVAYAASRRRPQ